MYSAPDFIKVEIKVSDAFAEYYPNGCPEVGAGGGVLNGDGCELLTVGPGLTATVTFPKEPDVCYTSYNK